MKYNKNIILNILSSEFWDEIVEYAAECIWYLDEEELFRAFEDEVDFAELDNIEKMKVIDYEIEEDGDIERILGTLDIWSDLNGYVQWDGENISMGSALVTLGIAFSFSVENGVYSDLELEHVY